MPQPFNTETSAKLFERAAQSLATGVSSGIRRNVTPVPLYFTRGDGAYFYDADGNELLDYTLAWGPLILGSNHHLLNSAIYAQLKKSYTFGAQHPGEIELAELMVQVLPGVDQVIFSNTGTEAVQAALRLARAATGRNKFIKFEGHYHGWLNNVLVSYHPKQGDPFTTQPSTAGQPPSEYADVLVLPWNDPDALKGAFERHPGSIAAVITEPLLANSGSCLPRDGYLQALIDLCRQHGAISIFDEVITGFRLALGGAREFFRVTPDLSVYAKAMAGGFTMAAVGGRRQMFDALRDGRTFHAGTYNGNSINLAAAIATIKVLREPGVYDRMHEHGNAIRVALEQSARRHNRPLVTTGAGTVFSAHFGVTRPPHDYRESLKTDEAAYTRFRALMLAHGVQLLPDGRWYIGAAHRQQELDRVIAAIERSFAELE